MSCLVPAPSRRPRLGGLYWPTSASLRVRRVWTDSPVKRVSHAHRALATNLFKSPIPAFLIKEVREALPAMVFFAIGFNLIVLTTQLILDDYGAQFAGFMVATATALVIRKGCWWRGRCHSSVGSIPLR